MKRILYLLLVVAITALCLTGCSEKSVEVPQIQPIYYSPDVTLADIELPDGWSWADGSIVPTADRDKYYAAHEGDDNLYSVTVSVMKAKPVIITQPEADAGGLAYGDPLPPLKGGAASVAGDFTYADESQRLTESITYYEWVFSPNDAVNYEYVYGEIELSLDDAGKDDNTGGENDDDQEPQYAPTVYFSAEAFTIGCGYVVEPVAVALTDEYLSDMSLHFFGKRDSEMMRDELNGAYLTEYILTQEGYGTVYTGDYDKGYYLSCITSFNYYDNICDALREKILDDGLEIDKDASEGRALGEFCFTNNSGWMYSVDGEFPTIGLSGYFPADGDVIRLQFTLNIGVDVGGGGEWAKDYFDLVNRENLTKLVAMAKSVGVTASSLEEAMSVLQIIGVAQHQLDEAYSNLMADYNEKTAC